MPKWTDAATVKKHFHGLNLSAEGMEDADINVRIERAERYVGARLRVSKATMDAWTDVAATPPSVNDVTAKYAAAEVLADTQGGSSPDAITWVNAWRDEVDKVIAEINVGALTLFDKDGVAVALAAADYYVERDATDREFTREKLERL